MEKVYDNIDKEFKMFLNEKKKFKKGQSTTKSIELFNKAPESTHVVYPVQGALLDLAQERMECLMAHLFGVSKNEYESNPTLKTCMSCENCTFNKSAKKVYSKIFNELTTIYQNTLVNFVNIYFHEFKKYFTYEAFEPQQIIAKLILNYKLINSKLDITQLFHSIQYDGYLKYDKICNESVQESYQMMTKAQQDLQLLCDRNISLKKYKKIVGENYYTYTDALTMVPNMNIIDGMNPKALEEIQEFKSTFFFFKSIHFDKILTNCLMEKMYFKVKHDDPKKELRNKKSVCNKILELYAKITMEQKPSLKSYKMLLKNRVTQKDFEYFNTKKREKDESLFLNMLKNELMEEEDYNEFMKQIPKYYYLLNKEYDQDEFLQQIMEKLTP